MELDWEIDEVPCVIEVIGVSPGEPEQRPIHDRHTGDLIDPGSPEVAPEIEYRVLDITGEESDLLSEMVDDAENRAIIEAIEEAFKQENSYQDY